VVLAKIPIVDFFKELYILHQVKLTLGCLCKEQYLGAFRQKPTSLEKTERLPNTSTEVNSTFLAGLYPGFHRFILYFSPFGV
jgi:hypothetical protein